MSNSSDALQLSLPVCLPFEPVGEVTSHDGATVVALDLDV